MLSSIRTLMQMPVNLLDVAMSAAHMKALDVKAAWRNRQMKGTAGLTKMHHGATGVAPFVNEAAFLKR